jgi:monoamine oxidase
LYEARAEPGGRVWSDQAFIPHRILECGAELIGLNHPVWIALARVFGLNLADFTTDDTYAALDLQSPVYMNGSLIEGPALEDLYDSMTCVFADWSSTALQALPFLYPWAPWLVRDAGSLDQQTLGQMITAITQTACITTAVNTLQEAITLQFYLNNTIDPSQQSWLANLAQFAAGGGTGFFEETEVLRCAGGNQALAWALFNAIGKEQVHFNTPVDTIDIITSGGIGVTLSNKSSGTLGTYDYAVLALPVSLVSSVAISLNNVQQPSIGATSHGHAVKYLSAIPSRFWIKEGLAPQSMSNTFGMTWEGTDNQMDIAAFDLSVFAGGNIADKAIAGGESFLENAIGKVYTNFLPTKQKLVKWPDKEYIKTGYSCPAQGEVVRYQSTYYTPTGGLLFLAGEYTSPAWFGYMEGALESGLVAAAQIAQTAGLPMDQSWGGRIG